MTSIATPSHAAARGNAIAQRYRVIDDLLVHCVALWRPRPFRDQHLPWMADLPQLQRWLLDLTDAQVASLEADHSTLCAALATYLPIIATLPALIQVPRIAPATRLTNANFAWEIAGRKWQQVAAFADYVAEQSTSTGDALPVLDWCAGKGHLARSIALHTHATVDGVERDATLCAEAARLAQRDGLPVRIHEVDVLSTAVEPHVRAGGHIVALHACGRLHLRLLRLAVTKKVSAVTLAPCCHHLCDAADTAVSQLGRASILTLAPSELQLAVQETVTAGASRRRDRDRESGWRLGFDLLQRQLRGIDEYLPVPSIPRALLRTSFAQFVDWAMARKQLSSTGQIALDEFERIGQRRHAVVTRLALLRHAFRRPLELRIVCDRACFLQEHGYEVAITEFCSREVTPRNLLIAALRA